MGKSTFFNLLAGRNKALVQDQPGVTRDLNYAEASWEDRAFVLVDSGGFETGDDRAMAAEVRRQVEFAMAEADLVLFMLDGRDPITAEDREIARRLRMSEKPVLLAVNKMDSDRLEQGIYEFYELGFDAVLPVSSTTRRGFGEFMDALISRLPQSDAESEEPREELARIAVIGRPNVGKSSLINTLCGYQRLVVSEIPGTTRDAIDIPFELGGKHYVFVDTAGIRRRAKVKAKIETYSIIKSLKSLDRCDIALLLLDAGEGITEQDLRIGGYAHDKGRGCIVVANKWDLKSPGQRERKAFEDQVRERFRFMEYAPILFVSAKTGEGIDGLADALETVRTNRARRIPTARLNQLAEEIVQAHQPPVYKGRRLKFYYITQTYVNPPTFVTFVNYPEAVHFTYERYIRNRIRKAEDFTGTPIWVKFRKRGRKWTGKKS